MRLGYDCVIALIFWRSVDYSNYFLQCFLRDLLPSASLFSICNFICITLIFPPFPLSPRRWYWTASPIFFRRPTICPLKRQAVRPVWSTLFITFPSGSCKATCGFWKESYDDRRVKIKSWFWRQESGKPAPCPVTTKTTQCIYDLHGGKLSANQKTNVLFFFCFRGYNWLNILHHLSFVTRIIYKLCSEDNFRLDWKYFKYDVTNPGQARGPAVWLLTGRYGPRPCLFPAGRSRDRGQTPYCGVRNGSLHFDSFCS